MKQSVADKADRFQQPKACVVASKNGTPTYGLQDRLAVRVNKHAFEAQKGEESQASQERINAFPDPSHFNRVYHIHVDSGCGALLAEEATPVEPHAARAAAADKAGSHRQYDTSADNPLQIAGSSQPTNLPAPKQTSRQTYARDGTTPALADCLGCSLVPRPPSSGGGGAAPPGETAGGPPNADEQRRQLEEQEEFQRRLLREYPHGVPKRVLLQLRAQGHGGGAGVNLPSLGYGDY